MKSDSEAVVDLEFKAESAKDTRLSLKRAADGRLVLMRSLKEETQVNVRRCFPWSEPFSWLSLRDDEGQELELIESLDEIGEDSRQVLMRALEEAGFVFTIEKIIEVEEEFELRNWRVQLREGERVFQTRLNAWPRELPSGGLLIQDVGNDFYLVPDLEKLEPSSQKILWAFLDD